MLNSDKLDIIKIYKKNSKYRNSYKQKNHKNALDKISWYF